MARKSWSLQDAKNSFSAVVDAAQSKPQTVTRHGKPAAVVISAEEFERLQQFDRMTAPTFAEHLLAMPADDNAFERSRARLRDTEF